MEKTMRFFERAQAGDQLMELLPDAPAIREVILQITEMGDGRSKMGRRAA